MRLYQKCKLLQLLQDYTDITNATCKFLLLLQDCTKNATYKLVLLLQDYTDINSSKNRRWHFCKNRGKMHTANCCCYSKIVPNMDTTNCCCYCKIILMSQMEPANCCCYCKTRWKMHTATAIARWYHECTLQIAAAIARLY